MKAGTKWSDAARLWAENVRRNASPRMVDDRAEQDFWREFMARKTGYAPEPSAQRVLAELLPLLRAYDVETALELGPGWGNYTIGLAKTCQSVDCVDISQDVLDFILRIGKEQGCANLRTIHSKWEEFTPQRSYDFVFGYNCFYRQADLTDCLSRMDRAADKLCAAGMNVAEVPPWCRELEAAGGVLQWDWKDYGYFAGVLRQMGVEYHVMELPFEQARVYPDTEALLRGECAQFAPGSVSRETAQEILRRHFTRRPDGSWHAGIACRSGVVWWSKDRKAGR